MRHLGSEDQNLKNLIREEVGKESFTHVIITGISPQHVQYLKQGYMGWCRQLA